MASHVMHYVAGNQFIKNYNVSEDVKAGFMLGDMIVDSSKIFGNEQDPEIRKQIKDEHQAEIQNEKFSTHFRRIEDGDKNIQLCDLKKFIEKYGEYMNNPTVLGYFFHLFTDNRFFKEVFDDAFICLNQNSESTDLWKETIQYKILKNNSLVAPKDFWSEANIYGDYTKMNRLVLDHFKINFNESDLLHKALKLYPNVIVETDLKNIDSIIIEANAYIKDSEGANAKDLKIFVPEKITGFINEVGNAFEEEYPEFVKTLRK